MKPLSQMLAVALVLFCGSVAAQVTTTSASPAAADPSTAPTAASTKVPSFKIDISGNASRYARKDAPAHITRFETPPVIDGILNDPQWQNATIFGDFLQTQPGDNVTPS